METSMLEVNGLTKKFRKFQLGPFHFKVEKGIVIGLVGANGSGKSTLLRLLMKLIKQDSGEVLVFGRKSTENEYEWKQHVGYAGELLEGYEFLTITEMKDLIAHWYPNWNEEKFQRLIKRYNIDVEEKFSKCSKGTKKKIEFIFAICHDPSLLLLDEPTAGVDIVSKRKMKEDLIHFMESGEKSILLATHLVDEINQLCDELIILEEGAIIHSYNKDDIYDNWARVWVSNVTENVKQHPSVIRFEVEPSQIITDDIHALETILKEEQIIINQIQRLSMEEVIEYLIELK